MSRVRGAACVVVTLALSLGHARAAVAPAADDPSTNWSSDLERASRQHAAAESHRKAAEEARQAMLEQCRGGEPGPRRADAARAASEREQAALSSELAALQAEKEILVQVLQKLPREVGYQPVRMKMDVRIVDLQIQLGDAYMRSAQGLRQSSGCRRDQWTMPTDEAPSRVPRAGRDKAQEVDQRLEQLKKIEDAELGRVTQAKDAHARAMEAWNQAAERIDLRIGDVGALDEELLAVLEEARSRVEVKLGDVREEWEAEKKRIDDERTGWESEFRRIKIDAIREIEEKAKRRRERAALVGSATFVGLFVLSGPILWGAGAGMGRRASGGIKRLTADGAFPCPQYEPECAARYDEIQDWRRYGNHGNRMYVAGIVLTAWAVVALSASVGLALKSTSNRRPRDRASRGVQTRLAPAVGRGELGLSLVGRF